MEKSALAVTMLISIDMNDFMPAHLHCLATALKRQYKTRKQIQVLIFSSHDAAQNFVPIGSESSPVMVKRTSELHAEYFLDADQHSEYLLMIPDALAPTQSQMDTRIELPTTTMPPCRLAVQQRCILALKHITYPAGAWKASVTGSVTMRATITPEGKVVNIKEEQQDGLQKETAELLAPAALENLGSWRFEPSGCSDDIKITYSYQIVASPRFSEGSEAYFESPEKVIVRANPLANGVYMVPGGAPPP
jgi:hypothetical protein